MNGGNFENLHCLIIRFILRQFRRYFRHYSLESFCETILDSSHNSVHITIIQLHVAIPYIVEYKLSKAPSRVDLVRSATIGLLKFEPGKTTS